jgi:hypothetical protein
VAVRAVALVVVRAAAPVAVRAAAPVVVRAAATASNIGKIDRLRTLTRCVIF